MMLYRGIEVTYESIREWCEKFGQQYANQLRRKRPDIADKWHLDEVVVTIKGQQYYPYFVTLGRRKREIRARQEDRNGIGKVINNGLKFIKP